MNSSIRKRTRRDEDDDNHSAEDNRGSHKYGGGGRANKPADRVHNRSLDSINDNQELFVGNITNPNATEHVLEEFINKSMRESRLIGPHEADPVVQCRLSKMYGFVEFRDVELATKGLHLNGIPFMGAPLKLGRPAKYAGPIREAGTWQQWMEQLAQQPPPKKSSMHPILGDLTTRLYREVFVGNCNEHMTDQGMQDFLGGLLYKMGMSNSGQENPVMCVKNSGKFAFVVCRTVEEAANLLNMTRVPFQGISLKFERPAKFDGGMAGVSHYQWEDCQRMWNSGELKLLTAGNPTKILRICGQAALADLLQSSTYVDMVEDTRNECAQFGMVRSVIIPRTSSVDGYPPEVEATKVFVEMNSIEEAKNALMGIKGRSFNGRYVEVRFYPEDKFRALNYSYEAPGVVLTSSFGPVFKEQVLNPATLKKLWAASEQQQHQ